MFSKRLTSLTVLEPLNCSQPPPGENCSQPPPGETISHTAVIEYQRRGLPHIHFLGEHAHDLHFHDHVPPDVHVPAQAVVAADREGADGVNVADVAEQAWEGGTWGVEAKWRRQGGCRGGSVDG